MESMVQGESLFYFGPSHPWRVRARDVLFSPFADSVWLPALFHRCLTLAVCAFPCAVLNDGAGAEAGDAEKVFHHGRPACAVLYHFGAADYHSVHNRGAVEDLRSWLRVDAEFILEERVESVGEGGPACRLTAQAGFSRGDLAVGGLGNRHEWAVAVFAERLSSSAFDAALEKHSLLQGNQAHLHVPRRVAGHDELHRPGHRFLLPPLRGPGRGGLSGAEWGTVDRRTVGADGVGHNAPAVFRRRQRRADDPVEGEPEALPS